MQHRDSQGKRWQPLTHLFSAARYMCAACVRVCACLSDLKLSLYQPLTVWTAGVWDSPYGSESSSITLLASRMGSCCARN